MIQITKEMIITFFEKKRQDYFEEGDIVFAKETEKSGQAFRFRLGILVDIYTWEDSEIPQPSSLFFAGKRMDKFEILHYPVEVDGDQSIQFIVMAEKLLVGSCMLWGGGFLGDFHIAHGWRKRGLGDAMFKKVKEIAIFHNLKTIWGTCMKTNPVIKFWVDRGFKIVGEHDEGNYKIEIEL